MLCLLSVLPLLLLEEGCILLITAVFIGDVKADVIETALTARMVEKSFIVWKNNLIKNNKNVRRVSKNYEVRVTHHTFFSREDAEPPTVEKSHYLLDFVAYILHHGCTEEEKN
jgi:hypothetical protein